MRSKHFDLDMEKIKELVSNLKPLDPLADCREGKHFDEFVGFSGISIYWRCRRCGRVTHTHDRPMTI